ncbi:MAG: ribonuclease R [Erysipelothrix sp.]|nr:ribonuclease R [Erysipelothrix sp.]
MKTQFKEQLLTDIQTQQPLTLEQWIENLNITNDQLEDFHEAVNELIQDYELAYSKKKKLMLASELGYVKGKLEVVGKDFGFVDVLDFSVYVKATNFMDAMDKDEVVARYWKTPDGRFEGEIVKVLKHNSTFIIGTMVADKKTFVFQSYDKHITQPIEYTNPSQFELKDQQRVIGEINSYGSPLKVTISSIIGLVKDPGVDILSVLHQYDIKMPFRKETLEEVKTIPQTVEIKDYPKRRDLTSDKIFTIDGDDTKDIDDAISIKQLKTGYQLGVHIADVSHYVREHTSLDDDASERSTSVYVVDRVVPMLPKELSNGICSLNPHVNRLAMSVHVNLDEYGSIVDYEFFESIIQSKQQLTYREVNRFYEDHEAEVAIDDSLKPDLLLMEKVSDLLHMQREALGSTDFETSESSFVVDEKGKVLDVYESERGRGETLIEDFMVTANHCAANYFDVHQLPTLYRVHERPTQKKMTALSSVLRIMGYRMKGSLDTVRPSEIQRVLYHFRNEPTYSMVSQLVLRSMQKAKYHPVNLGHFGLGLKQYLHFTSPIRRYPDLVVHRLMKKYNFNKNINPSVIKKDEERLVDTALWTSDRERNAVDAQRQVEKMKKAEYMQQFIGEHFEGMISGVTGFGLFVQLPNTCEGLVHVRTMPEFYVYDEQKMMLIGRDSGTTFQMGQTVTIKVTSVDMVDYEVSFEVVLPKLKVKKPKPKRKRDRKARA